MRTLRRALYIVLVALVASCGAAHAPVRQANQDERPTLYVKNTSGNHATIYVDGLRVGVATAGFNCFPLPMTMKSRALLTVKATGWQPESMEFEIGHAPHWRFRLESPYPGGLKFDLLTIVPNPNGPCTAKRT